MLWQHCAAAGVSHLLQWAGKSEEQEQLAREEGMSSHTGLLDGPTSLLTSLLACGPSSDAGLAATQAGTSIALSNA